MFRIRTYNQISDVGLSRLPLDSYQVGPDIEEPHALILRSHKLHGEVIPDSVLAVARAGAGVNNIPVDEYTHRGIVVFNTPGANANAVKELVTAALLLSSRGILAGAQRGRRPLLALDQLADQPIGQRAARRGRGHLLDAHPGRLAGAVPGARLDADQDRRRSRLRRLHGRGELEAVRRHHPVVVIGCGDQRGRIALALDGVVVGGVGEQGLEHLRRVLGGAVVGGPVPADGPGVVAQHVEHAHRRQHLGREHPQQDVLGAP